MSEIWPWAALVGLGLFHGINPAMGWLFAVALGLQERRRAAVTRALAPIALGHAASILLVILAVGAARVVVEPRALQLGAGLILLGFGAYRFGRGYRHKFRVGMRAGFADLALWSFLMATAHGAGLMLIPVLLGLSTEGGHGAHAHHPAPMPAGLGDSLGLAVVAAGVHTAAMLLATGGVAILVYDRLGLAILRRGWINLDLVWSLALILAGGFLLIVALV